MRAAQEETYYCHFVVRVSIILFYYVYIVILYSSHPTPGANIVQSLLQLAWAQFIRTPYMVIIL